MIHVMASMMINQQIIIKLSSVVRFKNLAIIMLILININIINNMMCSEEVQCMRQSVAVRTFDETFNCYCFTNTIK